MFKLKTLVLSGALLSVVFLTPLAHAADPIPANLNPADQADLTRIETYLNELGTMESRFLQFSEQGVAEGRIFLDRPDHLRIEYSPPVPVLMIASDLVLMFHDTELGQTTYLPVGQTPAGFLLEDKIELSGDVTVTEFERSAQAFRITLVQTEAPDSGTVTLMFEDNPLRLAKWRVIDAQGARVEIALLEPRFGVSFKNPRELVSTVDPNAGLSSFEWPAPTRSTP
jgi:outer membrane lipoprotein-sorting protein